MTARTMWLTEGDRFTVYWRLFTLGSILVGIALGLVFLYT
jgi:hypothetical protein